MSRSRPWMCAASACLLVASCVADGTLLPGIDHVIDGDVTVAEEADLDVFTGGDCVQVNGDVLLAVGERDVVVGSLCRVEGRLGIYLSNNRVSLPKLEMVAGSLVLNHPEASASELSAEVLRKVGGNLELTGQDVQVGLSGLEMVAGAVNVRSLEERSSVNLGSLREARELLLSSAAAIELGSLSTIGGDFTADTERFLLPPNLATVDGALRIRPTMEAQLSSEHLTSIGSLLVSGGAFIQEIRFSALTNVGSTLEITDVAVTSLALPDLRFVGQRFSLRDVNGVQDLSLGALEEVGGSSIELSFQVSRNPSIRTIGLPSLRTLGGRAEVVENQQLADCMVFDQLRRATEVVAAHDNGACN